MDNELDNIIVLQDENGSDVRFEFLDLIAYDGRQYVVLLPENDTEGEVVILVSDGEDGDRESYSTVEDEDTLEAVFAIFRERYEDEFNFADEDGE